MFFNTSFFAYYLIYSLVATIFLRIVSRRRASRFNDKSCVNKPISICKTNLLQERNKHVIYWARSVRMGKNCALGLEYGLGPYSRPRAQFFPIRTSHPVNKIYILNIGYRTWKECNLEAIDSIIQKLYMYIVLTRKAVQH